MNTSPALEIGRVYGAEELAERFGFHPYYLRTAGGMVPVPKMNAVLLVTHAGSEASFEYGDYWAGNHLDRCVLGSPKSELWNRLKRTSNPCVDFRRRPVTRRTRGSSPSKTPPVRHPR